MEEGLRGAKNQPSREEGKVPSENGRLERAQRLLGFRINERVCTAKRNLTSEMIANIENTTKSVSGEKEKEAKQTSKNKESAEKRIDRFSELYAYARKHGVFVRSFLFLSFSSQKTDLFLITFLRFTLLLLYSSKDV